MIQSSHLQTLKGPEEDRCSDRVRKRRLTENLNMELSICASKSHTKSMQSNRGKLWAYGVSDTKCTLRSTLTCTIHLKTPRKFNELN